jgi:DNA-binding CsgD family transcriptional regulator
MAAASRKSSPPLTKTEYELLAAFRYHLRQFLRFSEEAAQTAGLTPRQHQALLAIKGFPKRESVTIGELAEQLQIAHHTAVELVDRLAAQKLVERQDQPFCIFLPMVAMSEVKSVLPQADPHNHSPIPA